MVGRHTLLNTTILFLILIPLINAADPQTNPSTDAQMRLIISENLKTREDLKNYIDQRTSDNVKELQKAVDDNFIMLDQRVNQFGIKIALKLGIIWFATTFLAYLIGELLFRRIYERTNPHKTIQEQNIPTTTKIDPEIENMIIQIYQKSIIQHPTPTQQQIKTEKPTIQQNPQPQQNQSWWDKHIQKYKQQKIQNKKMRELKKISRMEEKQKKIILQKIKEQQKIKTQIDQLNKQLLPKIPISITPPITQNPTNLIDITEQKIQNQQYTQQGI